MKKLLTILIVIILIACCAGAFYTYDYLKEIAPNNNRISETDLFDVSGNEVAIMYNYTLQETKGVYKNGSVYIPLEWVRSCVNDTFYWDDSVSRLVYTTPVEILYPDDYIRAQDSIYLPLDLIQKYSNISVNSFLSNEAKRVFICDDWEDYQTAKLAKSTVLRTGESNKQREIIDVVQGEKVRILQEGEWTRIYSSLGYTGYVPFKDLGSFDIETPVSDFEEPQYTSIKSDSKILLAWHQVTRASANDDISNLLENTSGINVISPTWLSISDNNGSVSSLISDDYISYVHDKGIRLWVLIDDFNDNISTTKVLSNADSRKNLIDNIMSEVVSHGIDGINIDFERLESPASDAYAQFVRELSVSCRNSGVVLSVDNPNMAEYNKMYQRDVQARVCDYVINMGYNEHYKGEDPGPVSSLPFVINGLEKTLEEVPADKLINALPFYTRIWDSSKASSTAVGLQAAKEWAASLGEDPVWDSELCCYYYSNGIEQCWMEDTDTLRKKVEFCLEKNLAGLACWKLGLETPDVWRLLDTSEEAGQE